MAQDAGEPAEPARTNASREPRRRFPDVQCRHPVSHHYVTVTQAPDHNCAGPIARPCRAAYVTATADEMYAALTRSAPVK